jgi:hypothetical protein
VINTCNPAGESRDQAGWYVRENGLVFSRQLDEPSKSVTPRGWFGASPSTEILQLNLLESNGAVWVRLDRYPLMCGSGSACFVCDLMSFALKLGASLSYKVACDFSNICEGSVVNRHPLGEGPAQPTETPSESE